MNHNWDVSVSEAHKIQKEIQGQLIQKVVPKPIKYIAGADVSFNKFEKDVYAGIIVLSYPELVPVEYACIKMEVNFPYVPGFLSFREIPPLFEAWQHITIRPDIVMVDGHGIAHPRRLGIAAHFGLVIELPTMGAAKNILYGTFPDPGLEKGGFSYITDPKNHEHIGVALRTKNKVKPMFISPGHLCTIEDAIMIGQETARKYRLPEPTRLAHNLVNQFRTGQLPDKNFNHFLY